LNLLPENAEIHNSATLTSQEIGGILLNAKSRSCNVARLHTGDPSIFSAIAEQIEFCRHNNIPCEVVPGVSSFTACAAVLKKELTLAGITQTVILTRCEGRTAVPVYEHLETLAASRSTMCIFLSIGLVDRVAASLRVHYPDDTSVAVVHRATWPDEQIVHCNLNSMTATVTKMGIKKTAIILVGKFLCETGAFSKLYDESFTHEFRKK
jgi:precorrin-4/cobalt-precorrin-4 C11-methyltransferase